MTTFVRNTYTMETDKMTTERMQYQKALDDLLPLRCNCPDAFHEHKSVQYEAADYMASHLETVLAALASAAEQKVPPLEALKDKIDEIVAPIYDKDSISDRRKRTCKAANELVAMLEDAAAPEAHND